MNLRPLRTVLWGLVAGVAGVLVSANAGWLTLPGATPSRPADPDLQTALPVGGESDLVDQNGAKRTWAQFRGKPVAVFFGFTHCPDICPTTLGELSVVLADLKERGDPKRDTPTVLKEYMQSFDPRIVALTGSEAEVEKAFTTFRASRKIVPQDDGDYTIDHSAGVYLYDAGGGFVGTLDRDERQAVQLEKIRRLIDSAAEANATAGKGTLLDG